MELDTSRYLVAFLEVPSGSLLKVLGSTFWATQVSFRCVLAPLSQMTFTPFLTKLDFLVEDPFEESKGGLVLYHDHV